MYKFVKDPAFAYLERLGTNRDADQRGRHAILSCPVQLRVVG